MPLEIVDITGDTAIAYTPISEEAQKDLDLFTMEDHQEYLVTNKELDGFHPFHRNSEGHKVYRTLKQNNRLIDLRLEYNTGKSEHQEDISARYGEKKARQFDKMMKANYTASEQFELQKDAAIEFSYMKNGTANAGNIGNLMRNLMFKEYGMIGIKIANLIYHTLAQAALDCKNSLTEMQKLQSAFDAFRSKYNDWTKFYQALTPYFVDEAIQYAWQVMSKNGKWKGAISMVISTEMPIAHTVNAGNIADLYIATKNLKLGIKEGSFVEYLLSFVHPRNTIMFKKGLEKDDAIAWSSDEDEQP